MDDRNRTAPEPLAGNAPVSQAIVGDALAEAFGFQPVGRLRLRLFHRQSVEPFAVDGFAFAHPRFAFPVFGRANGADDVAAVGFGELPVALVFAGHCHNHACAVAHQHIIGQIQRHGASVERVGEPCPCKNSAPFGWPFRRHTLYLAALGDFSHESFHFCSLGIAGEFHHTRMLGRHHHECHPERCVGPSCEDANPLAIPRNLQREFHTLRRPDPIPLHGFHTLWPGQRL